MAEALTPQEARQAQQREKARDSYHRRKSEWGSLKKKIYAKFIRPEVLAHRVTELTSADRRMIRIAKHREWFHKRLTRTLECKAEHGLSSYWADRWAFTESWLKISLLLGRRCVYCDRSDVWDPSWKLVLKDDPCFCVPNQAWAYEKVLREGVDKYQLWCPWCHAKLWKQVRVWLWTPNCPRRYPLTHNLPQYKHLAPLNPDEVPFGPAYARMWEFVKRHYPSDDAKLRAKDFPHLMCWFYNSRTGVRTPRPFIRTKPGPWVAHNSVRSLFQPIVEEAALYYLSLYPDVDVTRWGHFSPLRRAYYPEVETREPLKRFLSDDMKEFLKKTPPIVQS